MYTVYTLKVILRITNNYDENYALHKLKESIIIICLLTAKKFYITENVLKSATARHSMIDPSCIIFHLIYYSYLY